jgi:pimeloyl-ACP methyl ester carboxylesterase
LLFAGRAGTPARSGGTDVRKRKRRVRRWWRWPLRITITILLAVVGWGLGNGLRMLATEDRAFDSAGPGRGRWVQAHDVKLHVTEQGAADAPLLVLVGGTGAWAGTWVGNIDAIQRAGWRVVTIDLPPFGFSARPADHNYTRDAQAKRLLAAIRTLGGAPVVLLGHSYGGGPAAEAAMLEPTLIRQLILVDAAIGLRARNDSSCEVSDWANLLLGWRPLRSVVVANTATQPLLTATLIERFVARTDAVTPERAAIYREPFKVIGTSAAIGDWAFQFATSCESPRSQSAANFSALKPPLTLIWGEADSITPLRQARDIAAATPGARLEILPGVGHIPQIEDAALFNKRLIEVLNRIR